MTVMEDVLLSSNPRCFLLSTLLCLPLASAATTVHRCEDGEGRITFTTLSCTAGERLSQHEVRTYLPGSTVAVMPDADTTDTSGMKIPPRPLVVVGRQEAPCDPPIDARQRRDAILNKRIIAGMTVRDVESVLGKPDKINVQNSSTSYRYTPKRGRSAQVVFDEKGCVKGKPQTAKSPQ